MPSFGTDERRLLHESLQDYLGTSYTFETFRKLQKTPQGFGREKWAEYGQLGWLGMAMPEEAGGAGGIRALRPRPRAGRFSAIFAYSLTVSALADSVGDDSVGLDGADRGRRRAMNSWARAT